MTKRRNTQSKQEILSILQSGRSLLSQEMVEEKLKGRLEKQPNRSTIYRVLNTFCEEGITHKTVSDEGVAYYALCDSCESHSHTHDHVHFQCEECEKVECLEEETSVTLPKGYQVKEANLWVRGICGECG